MHPPKRRPNNGMNSGGGNGQHRHHNNNRPRRFTNNGGNNRSDNDSGNVTRTRRNAQQNKEKYQNMARDAMSSGDRVLAENYLQHADHYHRVILSLPPEEAPRQHNQQRNHGDNAGNGEHQQHDNGAEGSSDNAMQENDQQMPSVDALPSFITQPMGHLPQNSEE